jgi:DNA polymerase
MTHQAPCAATGSAGDFLPRSLALPVLKKAAEKCHGCDLYCNATQVVFGEGPATAAVLFVGEQPGDQEDRAGKPFVGPSGHMLDEALEEVGIDRADVYVTNAVKHFQFEMRGQRRLHARPTARQISACRPWLEAEIASVKPKVVVCLGATAAQALMGRGFRITKDHGKRFTDTDWAPVLIATNHPSAILRAPDADARRRARATFVADLRIVRRQIDRISRDAADANAERKRRLLHPGQAARPAAKAPPDARSNRRASRASHASRAASARG